MQLDEENNKEILSRNEKLNIDIPSNYELARSHLIQQITGVE